ncbi:hypothetical protein FRB99_003726 [Tulasnella sp. 403]|nr:hypothetical protein FRB99_003726 [Tulasnella sp. 403]
MSSTSVLSAASNAFDFILAYVTSSYFHKGYHPVPADPSSSQDEKPPAQPKDTSTVRITKHGIWTVWTHIPSWADSIPFASLVTDVVGLYKSLPTICLLLQDLFNLGPWLLVTYILGNVVSSVLPAARLAQSSFLLHTIETAITTKQSDRSSLTKAIALQFLCSTVEWATYQSMQYVAPTLQQRFRYHFNQRLLAVNTRLDIPTCESPEIKAKLSAVGSQFDAGCGWDAFEKLVNATGLMVELIAESGYILNMLRNQPGGKAVIALCLMSPLINSIQVRKWSTAFYASMTNQSYLRMIGIFSFSNDRSLRHEIIGNQMDEFLQDEYKKAKDDFGDTTEEFPWAGFRPPFSLYTYIRALTDDSATSVMAIMMILRPNSIPLASLAMLDQTSMVMNMTMYRLFDGRESIVESFNRVKALYEVDKIETILKDGLVPYPPIEESDENGSKGMKVEFRNVGFKYPGNEKVAIKDLSFTVPAGSICVIVGENGCGKSSSVKLLSRMYDVTDGQILIDDRPIQDYKLRDLRASSAIMYQDCMRLSFTENIGFGNVERIHDLEAIKEAARLGGADGFIQKLPLGYQTRMQDDGTSISCGDIPKGSALEKMIQGQVEPPKAFSGGETQRLALSRTFLRSTTCDIKLMVYDEPSAALDPKAEFELFEKLRNQRAGRTLVFITHRFGYLTKYADLIVYLEDGVAVEKGSHDELLALKGKYAHLYNVQAQAFA